jgi:hypothetical protein
MSGEPQFIHISLGYLSELCNTCVCLYDYCTSLASLKQGFKQGTSVLTDTPERIEKMEDTQKDKFEKLLQKKLPEVKIHTGGQAQEDLRAAGAYAMTRGNDIYIRDESYLEGTQLTDIILIHELTHVLQMKKKKIREKEEIAEAEKAAEQNEKLVQHDEDPFFYAEIGGKTFYLNKKIQKEAVYYAVEELKKTIEDAYRKEDIELLCRIQKILGGNI